MDLTESIVYSRRCIKPVWGSKVDRRPIPKLDGPLITHRATVNLTACARVQLEPCEPLSLHVPNPYPEAKYPHLLFGISTTYDRLNVSLDTFAHWLSGAGVRLIAIVVDAEPAFGARHDLAALEQVYRDRSIDLQAFPPRNKSLTIAQNHFAVLGRLLEAATPQTRWFGIVDDDTFFPSLYRLDEELKKHNHKRPAWLGALSEDFDSVRLWGYMAYGGAGVFVSVPLARQLVPHMEACLAEATLPTGDGILRDCIHDHTMTKLTIVPGLYQHDLYGDLAGFYESGVLPLSVHHWRTWYKAPVAKMAAVSRLCGDCFLQRWRFGADTLLANGFSVSQYRRGLDAYDLTQMEGTWSHPGREFDFSLGPLRPAIDEHDKKSYRLKDAVASPDGTLRQIYVYRGDFATEEMDEVLELVWEGGEGMVQRGHS